MSEKLKFERTPVFRGVDQNLGPAAGLGVPLFIGVDPAAGAEKAAVVLMGGRKGGKNAVLDASIERIRRECPLMTVIDLRKDKP